jgi:superfamily II DNA or RNA helicase/tetratricopeptide (TPR) repeat protein
LSTITQRPPAPSWEELKPRLDGVSKEGRILLRLLTLFYLPTRLTPIRESLKRLKDLAREHKLKGPFEFDIPEALQQLEDAGLVLSDKNAYRLPQTLREEVAAELLKSGQLQAFVKALPKTSSLTKALRSFPEAVRDFRLDLYRGDRQEFCVSLAELVKTFPDDYERVLPLCRIAAGHHSPDWLNHLEPSIRALLVQGVVLKGSQRLEPAPSITAWLAKNSAGHRTFRQLYFEEMFLIDSSKVKNQIKGETECPAHVGWYEFSKGRYAKARLAFEEALVASQRETSGKVSLFGYPGFLYPLTLLKAENYEQARRYLNGLRGLDMKALMWLVDIRQRGGIGEPLWLPRLRKQDPETSGLELFNCVLCLYWAGVEEAVEFLPALEKLREKARSSGYLWVDRELGVLIRRLWQQHPNPVAGYQELGEAESALIDILQPTEAWRRTMDALRQVAQEIGPQTDERVIWRVEEDQGQFSVKPLIQKRSKRGGWTTGRELLPARILNKHADCLIEQDRSALRTLVQGLDAYRVGDETTLAELVGHPYVYWEDQPEMKVEVDRGAPELRVLRQGEQIVVDIQPVLPYFSADVGVLSEGPHRVRVYRLTEAQKSIAQVLGRGFRVPVEALEEISDTVEALSPVIGVQSEFLGNFAGAKAVEPDSSLHLFVLPHNSGLKFEIRILPLGAEGPLLRPGQGGRSVVAETKTGRLQTVRDFDAEMAGRDQLLHRCAALRKYSMGGFDFSVEDPVDCLEILDALAQGEDLGITFHWPEGKSMSVTQPQAPAEFTVKKSNDWFAVDASLKVDEDTVLDVRQLLQAHQEGHGRFLSLGHGRFVALTEKIKKQLERLADLSHQQGDEVALHPLAAMAAFGQDTGVALRGDSHWKDLHNRVGAAMESVPKPPHNLQAQLRDYQIMGFQWMSRLANAGMGACLADDMGLGKTLQALACILDRASGGPTLVVAPTSVCPNWVDEARRFAPTLRPYLYSEHDRARLISDAGPFDVIIVSYGLLTRETERFTARQWRTLVLDEAQAIKNYQTKRFQSVTELPADFRLATTGTPIENNLDELWTLFHFLNPGLLGTRDIFTKRFAGPIENGSDPRARARLRDVVRPFILRRLKSEVLHELPPRTEITLRIEMEAEEKALYENLRRQAAERFENEKEKKDTLAVLAELMKLRRLCCHPDLVVPGANVEASKLDAFRELVAELLENGHKALVFSQFVDVLGILREQLDHMGVSYQYLDGSTPQKERAKRVADFQNGQGDLFLISLKAGGTGLNLTAADFVIHYDPWWNPAVEDQASDRAYRMGQTRPVTVYRLVARGTIEEKIVELHRSKRDLASSLLEGTDTETRLDSDQLIALLQASDEG